MAADLVNLNKARKARARAQAAERAAENRVRFGQTKAQRAIRNLDEDRSQRSLDGHAREGRED